MEPWFGFGWHAIASGCSLGSTWLAHTPPPLHTIMLVVPAQELLCDKQLDNAEILSQLQAAGSDPASIEKLLNSEAARSALAARLTQVRGKHAAHMQHCRHIAPTPHQLGCSPLEME